MRISKLRTRCADSIGTSRRSLITRLYLPSLIAGAVGKLGPFAALIILAWTMNPQDFGVLAAAILVSQSLAGLFAASTLPTVARRAARLHEFGEEERAATSARLPLMVSLSCSIIGVIIAAPFVSLVTGNPLDWRFAAMGALTGAPVLLDGLLNIHAGHGRTRVITRTESFRGILTFVLTLAAGNVWGAWAAVAGMLVAESAVAATVLFELTRTTAGLSTSTRSLSFGESEMHLTLLAFVGNLMVQLGMWSLQLSLARQHGLIVLAAYGVASRFATAALLLPTFLTRNLLGHMSRAAERPDRKQYAREMQRYLSISATLALFAGVVAVLFSISLFSSLFARYPLSVTFLFVLLLSSIPAALNSALGVVLISLGSWRSWVTTDVAFAVTSVTWTLGCLLSDQGPITLLCGLPISYTLLAGSRAVGVARTMKRVVA